MKSLAVFIGRFSPLHNGHKEVIDYGFKNFDELLVIVGSADQSSRLSNPFTIQERRSMVLAVAPKAIIKSQNDYPYNNNQWVKEIEEQIRYTEPTLLCSKPEWYHKLLPYKKIVVPMSDPALNSTWIRSCWGTGWIPTIYYLPQSTIAFLSSIKERRKLWAAEWFDCENQKAKYPGIAVTTDAMVTCQNKILLVTRGKYPGKGQLALPGGFLEEGLWLQENAKKELKEETGLNINWKPAKVRTFDWPKRSSRNRTITTCFHWPVVSMYDLQAGDDAASAGWYEIDRLDPTKMFEDHYHIIQEMRK